MTLLLGATPLAGLISPVISPVVTIPRAEGRREIVLVPTMCATRLRPPPRVPITHRHRVRMPPPRDSKWNRLSH